MDAAACVRILDRADAEGCVPVIWNHWRKTPTDPARIATLVMGRAVECCAPIVVSDVQGIHEVVELSNRNKIPARRTIQSNGEAIIDLGYAWGWKSAFKWSRNTFRKLSGPAPSIGIDHWPKAIANWLTDVPFLWPVRTSAQGSVAMTDRFPPPPQIPLAAGAFMG